MNRQSNISPSQFLEPLSLKIGIGLFVFVQVLANSIYSGTENETIKNIIMGAFLASLILVAFGALQVVIRNEKQKLQTREDKMRRFYLYFIGVVVIILFLLPALGYLYGRLE